MTVTFFQSKVTALTNLNGYEKLYCMAGKPPRRNDAAGVETYQVTVIPNAIPFSGQHRESDGKTERWEPRCFAYAVPSIFRHQ